MKERKKRPDPDSYRYGKSESPEDRKKSEIGPSADGSNAEGDEKKSEGENKSDPDNYQDEIPRSAIQNKSELKTKSEIENRKSEIKSMEVHHHPDIEKKGLKEYILEGLMIFLAVTMGFFAEGLREHINDNAKETEYIISLKQDLQHDTANLSQQIHLINVKIVSMDSLILLLNKSSLSANEINDAYFYARIATRKPTFEVTDRTVIQLKSSGMFRLIKNEGLISRIMEYQKQGDTYEENSENDVNERQFLYSFISKTFDANVFQTMVDGTNIIHRPAGIHSLKKTDKEFINEFIYYIHQLKSSFILEKEILIDMNKKAGDMTQMIHNDYNE